MPPDPTNLGELQVSFSAAATNGSLLDAYMDVDFERGEFDALTLMFDKRKMPASQVKVFAKVLEQELPQPEPANPLREKLPQRQPPYDITSDQHTIQLRFYPLPGDEYTRQQLETVVLPADGILNQKYIDNPYAGLIRSAARLTEGRMADFSNVHGKERLIFRENIVPAVAAFRNKILATHPTQLTLKDVREGSITLLNILSPNSEAVEQEEAPPLTKAEAAFIDDVRQMVKYGAIVHYEAQKRTGRGNSGPSMR